MSKPLGLVLEDLLPLIASHERNHPEAYPEESIRTLYEAGIIGGPFAEEFGGRGIKLVEAVSVVETIASVSPSVALIASMPPGARGYLRAGQRCRARRTSGGFRGADGAASGGLPRGAPLCSLQQRERCSVGCSIKTPEPR